MRMPKRDENPKKGRPYFEVAFTGGDLRPDSVAAEDLAKLVIESISLLRAVAASRGVHLPALWLKGIYKGSAAAHLYAIDVSRDEAFERVALSTQQAVKRRGKRETPEVRGALERVYGLTRSGPGPIRIAARNVRPSPTGKRPRAVHVARPVEDPRLDIRSTMILHGRVVGLEEVAGRIDMKMQARGHGKIRLVATASMVPVALQRFGRGVRVRARAHLRHDGEPDEQSWRILSIEEWEGGDAMEGFDAAREALHAQGIRIDIGTALRALQSDEDE